LRNNLTNDPNIENLGEIVTPVDVKDNSEGVVRFDLKAPKVPQKAIKQVGTPTNKSPNIETMRREILISDLIIRPKDQGKNTSGKIDNNLVNHTDVIPILINTST
jgi:hypothetical protein